jgi:immune inhibitor A
MLKPLLVLLFVISAAPACALGIPPSLIEELEKSGRWPALASILDSARERGVADRERSVSLWLGPNYNLRGRLPDRVVVLLVDFPDKGADRGTFTRSWYSNLLFSAGQTATGSFRDYYREISYGAFDVTGMVSGWYVMPQPLAFYTGGEYGLAQYPVNAQRLAEDAIRAADGDVNFALFDNDGADGLPDSGDDDGVVDAVLVVHAGPAAEHTGSPGDIWSHQWSVHETVGVDGVRAGLYWTVPEDARIGVICHEFGHILGLGDLYDVDFDGAGLGWWSLMAYGAWSGAGMTPPHPDAMSRVQLGFVTPIVPDRNLESVSIPPVEGAPVIYRLWTNGAGGHEYFLIENRRRTGFDASVPSEGLLIYHVDETVPTNFDEEHYRVALEQSDSQHHLELGFWHGNLGDAGDPYPGILRRIEFSAASDPANRAYNRTRTGVAVRHIRTNGTTIVADLETFGVPAVEPIGVVLDDADGDGCLAAGESGSVAVRVLNAGEAGGPWEAEIESLHPALAFAPGAVGVPAMTAGPSEAVSAGLPVQAIEGASGTASMTVRLREAGRVVSERTFTLSLEAAPERVDGVDDRDGWTVDPGGAGALWVRTIGDGRAIWKLRGGYGPQAEAALTSPVFAARPQSVMRFAYRAALPGPEGTAADGVDVEGSLNGGPWAPLDPVSAEEYPVPSNPATPLTDREALSDTTATWINAVYALGEGGAWAIRFRFGSDAIVNGGLFEVDSLSAGTGLTAASPRVFCRRSSGTVRIFVFVESPERYAGAAFLRRDGRSPDTAFRRLHEGWLPVDERRIERVDEGVRGDVFYRVDLLLRSGGLETIGPFSPEGESSPARLLLMSPNPFRGAVRLAFDAPDGTYRLCVFDVSGREVAEIASGAGARTGEAFWNGLDRKGRPAGAGLYFFRLEWPGGSTAVRAVRLP